MPSTHTGSSSDPIVRTTVGNGIGTVTLADPEHRNALSKQLSDELSRAVHEVIAAGASVLLLEAEPPVFSAGGSLDGLIERRHGLEEMYAGYLALAEATIPTIAAVAGPAVGAGVNLALACDVILAGESARFDPRFLDIGIHPGGGHLWQLSRRVGVQGAAALVLCGDALTGAEAAARGLVWRCVPDNELPELARQFARRVAGRSPELVRRTKQTLRHGAGVTDLQLAIEWELEAQQWSIEQPYFHERVREVRDRVRHARTT